MKLHEHGTHNNPVLKIVAATFFLVFPLFGFVMGAQYQAIMNPPKTEYITTEKIIKESREDTERSLIRRCGTIPDEVMTRKGHFDMISGPTWSPDCRNVAWSLWESGTGFISNDPNIISQTTRTLSGREGVFVYNYATKRTVKIYSPTKLDETPSYKNWLDRNTIVFIAGKNEYHFDLTSNQTTPIKKLK